MINQYESTEEAYAACQTDETVKNGDTLIVETEEVIGLAWTWPVAVTVRNGELHTLKIDCDMVSMIVEAGWNNELLAIAVAIADARGWPVRPQFHKVK